MLNNYAFIRDVESAIRQATWAVDPQTGEASATFSPALNATEQAIYDDLLTMARFGLSANITLAEFRAIKPDLATARAFVGIASPTAAQSNAALKATIRVLGALLRQ